MIEFIYSAKISYNKGPGSTSILQKRKKKWQYKFFLHLDSKKKKELHNFTKRQLKLCKQLAELRLMKHRHIRQC